MIDALSKGLNQKSPMIKGAPPVTPSRAFALWLALLFLYFLLLPSAADSPHGNSEYSAPGKPSLSMASRYRQYTSPQRR